MRIEQGVKIADGTDNEVTVIPDEYYINGSEDSGYIIHQARRDNPFKIVAVVPEEKQLAIKIAKMLNEDLKRGEHAN